MNEEDKELFLDLLEEAEVELDAWKDRWPDVAGNTTELLRRIRETLHKYRPEPDFNQEQK